MTGDTGKIRYPQRSKQIIDFSGIRFGNATPSNVDGLLELDNHFFVIFEFKHISAAKMSKGQRMMIERVCDEELEMVNDWIRDPFLDWGWSRWCLLLQSDCG